MRLLILTLLLSGCSYFKRDNKPVEATQSEAVKAKKEFYCAEGRKILESKGFMDDRCDALLFTSLFDASCGGGNIGRFEGDPGKWHRNPERDCFINGQPNGSASSISRDMFLGLWHSLYKSGDLANIKEIISYGEKNSWVMGEAKDDATLVSRCLLTPQLISLLFDIESKLAGRSLLDGEPNSSDAGPLNTGFRAHLDILRTHLSGLTRGGLSGSELSLVVDQAKRQPRNALFVALAAKYGKASPDAAYSILLDESLYPANRLPTSADRCINYLNSRDQEDETDWKPCPAEGLTHDGTDFVFAASILDGTF